MSWGYRIFILYAVFVSGMLFLVYKCTQEDVDLVSPDYYARELKFQDHINRLNNNEAGGYALSVTYDRENNSVHIDYPPVDPKKIKGEIVFFRPDNSKLDFKVAVHPENGKQVISTAQLEKGYWRIQTTWEVGDIPLYQEEKIHIQ